MLNFSCIVEKLPVAVLSGLLALVACSTPSPEYLAGSNQYAATPSGPSDYEPRVMALPGHGKDFGLFQQEDNVCRQFAYAQVRPSDTRDDGQQRYDTSYTQCMYAHSNTVQGPPGSQSSSAVATVPASACEIREEEPDGTEHCFTRAQHEAWEAAALEKRNREQQAEKQRQDEEVAATREREAAAWAALPEEEKQRRTAEQKRSACLSRCSSLDYQCHSNNTDNGVAAFGIMGGGMNGLMAADIVSKDCNGANSSCIRSCP